MEAEVITWFQKWELQEWIKDADILKYLHSAGHEQGQEQNLSSSVLKMLSVVYVCDC